MSQVLHTLISFATGVPPKADEVADALRAAGHKTQLTISRAASFPDQSYELAVAPDQTAVFVQVGQRLEWGSDAATCENAMVSAMVKAGMVDETEAAAIQRLVYIGHWDHADRQSVDALRRVLCKRMNARSVSLPITEPENASEKIDHFQARVMRHRDAEGRETFAVHEVYFNRAGKPITWTEDSLSPRAATIERLIEKLAALRDECEDGDAKIVCGDLGYEYDVEDIQEWLEDAQFPVLEYLP